MAQAKMDFIINTKVDKTAFSELKREIQALQGLTEKDLVNLGSASSFQEAKKQLAAIQSSATTVETALNKAFSPKLGTVSLSKFNNELKKIDIQQLADNFSKAGAAGTAAFRSLTTNVLTTKVQIKETHKLLDDMGKTMTNTIKWGLSSSAWNTMTGSFQKAYGYIKSLDKSLNNIRIVSGKTADDMARFAQQANNAAKTLGSKTTDYTDAALIYYQQGLNEDEVLKRTDATIKMANVLGASAEEVSNYMTAIWNNFDDGSKSVEYYADVLAKLGAATASSAEEISTGLEKFAAIADTVGLSYEYATAALTTVTATTRQSAEVVGTAFKTLFARIQDLELGETLEDGVTLGKYSEALSTIGVNVIDASGNLKDMNSILDDMGSKWDNLTDAQKVSLAQTVAGTRQYTQMIALMDNWDTFEENVDMALNATGELNKQQDIYMESTQAHLDRLSASAERLYKSLIDSEGLNDLIDALGAVVTGVSEYTEAIGGSKSVLLQLGNIATKAFGRTISQGIATSITNIKKLKEQAADFNAQAAIISKFKGIQVSDESFKQLVGMAEAMNRYKDTLSEIQVEEGNALMSGYNDAVNARDKWQEAKTYAESFYQFMTKKEVGSLDQTFSDDQLKLYFDTLDKEVQHYAQGLSVSKKEIEIAIQERSRSGIEAYLDTAAEMIEEKIIKNEEIEQKIKGILEKYKESPGAGDPETMSEVQAKALEEFAELYGKVGDGLLKDTAKVKEVFENAQKGASKTFKTAVDEAKENWKDFIGTIDIQSVSQTFINMTGQIMSISSAIQSVGNLPSIWKNEDLTTGEKILQTIIAVGNSLNGISQTMQLVHTTADILNKTLFGNAGATALAAQAQKVQNEEAKDAKPIQDALQKEMLESKTAQDNVQKEIIETTQNTASNTLFWDKNTAAVRQNSAALVEQYNVRQKMNAGAKNVTLEDDLLALLGEDVVENVSEEAIDEVNKVVEKIKDFDVKLDNSKVEKVGKEYKETLAKTLKDDDKEIIDLFDLIDVNADDAVEGMADKIDDVIGEGLTAKDFGLADDVVENLDEATDAVENLGKAANGGAAAAGAGKGIFGTLKADLGVIGNALKLIPPQAWLVAAAIGTIAVAWKVFDYYSEENVLKRQLEEAEEAAKKAREEYTELKDVISSYSDVRKNIDELTEGTLEFYEAILSANEKANELIETLGLLPEIDYTIGAGGLIQIDEEALNEAAWNKMQETHRAQSHVYETELKLEKVNQGKIIRNFMNAVNQETARQGSSARINQDQARTILESSSNGESAVLGEIRRIISIEENQSKSLGDINKTSVKNTENMCRAVGKSSEDFEATLGTQELAIGESLSTYLPAYMESKAREDNKLLLNIEEDIYGYLSENQIMAYNNMSSGSKEAIKKILANRKMSTSKTTYDENDNTWKQAESFDIHGGGIFRGGKLGARIAHSKWGDTVDKLKDEYLQHVYGWSYDEKDEIWSKDGVAYSKDSKEWQDKRNELDITKVIKAHNSGSVFTRSNYEKEVDDVIDKGVSLASKKGLSGTSSDYVTEALLRLKAGTADKEFFDLLTKEEKDALHYVNKEEIYADDDGKLTDKKAFIHDIRTQYSSEQINDFLNTAGMEDGERSISRIRKDLEEYNGVLQTTAETLGTTSKALEFYGKALHNAEGTIDEHTRESAKAIANQYKFNKSFNESVQIYYNNEDAIKAYRKAMEDGEKVSFDLADAMGELAESLETMFDTELSTDFIEEQFEQIQKILTGTEEEAESAYREIKALLNAEAMTNALGEAMTLAGKDLTSLSEAIANLDIKEDLTLGKNFSKQLIDMVNNAHMTVSEMEALFNSLELEIPPYKVEENKVEVKSDTIPENKTRHHYDGWMIVPDAESEKGYREVDVDYYWDEWTEPYQYSYVSINNNANLKSTGKSKTNFKLSQANQKAKSGGSSSKPKKEDKIEDQKDRYHDINVELKQIANELEKVQDEQEKLTGSDLIANLQRQYNLLNKEIDATARKIGIARGEQEELQGKLAGSGVRFAADGTISNYAEAWDAQLAYVNSVIDKYNGMSAKAQENYQETLEKAKNDWNKFKDNIERYDTLITDDIPGLEADIRAALDQQIEIKLEAFEYEIEIRLDMSEAMRDWNEFKKKIIDGIKDDDILGNAKAKLADFSSYYNKEGNAEVQATTTHVNKILEQLKQMDADQAAGVYGETYTYTNASGKEVTVDYNNRKQALEDLKEYYTKLMGSMTDVQELIEEIHQSYMDMMDEAQEKFDEQLTTYQTIDEIIQHDMNLVQLMYGDSASLAKYYKEQRKNLDNQLDFQKQQVEFWRNQMNILEQGSEEWERAKENWIIAGNEWRTLAETNLQVITDEYTDAINTIFENLNNSVTNNLGLDYVSKEWELINQNADRYLDQVNSIYETQALQNKYLDAIEQSTNPAQQKKLNDLMEEEVNLLKEKDKLSQYDIDRANLKYEIAMKQMALEESQQKKTQLRLRRDSQGNYSYQYTNDESEVSKLKDELSDLYNQLYNLDAGQYKNNLDELYNVWEAYQQDMREASLINDPEKRLEREEMLQREYGELINGIVADNEDIKQNLQQSTMSQLLDLYDQNKDNYEEMTAQQQEILDNFISEENNYNNSAFNNLFNLYDENLIAFEEMTTDQINTLMNSFIPQWDSGVQQMADSIIGQGGFIEVTKGAFEEMQILAKIWDEERTAAYNEAIEMAQKLQEETEELAKDNTELIETYNKELEAVRDVINELNTLIETYGLAEQAAKDAAEAAYKYWQAASNANANTDTKIETQASNKQNGELKQEEKKENTQTNSLGYASNGAPFIATYTVKSGDTLSGIASRYGISWSRIYTENKGVIGGNPNLIQPGQTYKIPKYATGGYTGDWAGNGGQLAMLHKKELVLNANDTKNMLNAVEILRSITSSLGQTLMNQMANISATNASTIAGGIGEGTLEQSVHIEAQFPNVTNSTEIENALNNLVNRASQYIQRK